MPTDNFYHFFSKFFFSSLLLFLLLVRANSRVGSNDSLARARHSESKGSVMPHRVVAWGVVNHRFLAI